MKRKPTPVPLWGEIETCHDPLEPGAVAPNFSLSYLAGGTGSLRDFLGQSLILAFYPREWDPTREEQLALYNRALSQLPDPNPALIGISREGLSLNLAFAQERVSFPFVAGPGLDGEVTGLYGVTGQQALFVVDGDGIIRWSHVAPVGVHPRLDDVMNALHALQPPGSSSEKAASRPGSGVMKPMVTRREFLITAVAAALVAGLPHRAEAATSTASSAANPAVTPAAEPAQMNITLTVNGKQYPLHLAPRVTLLDALRERLGLTGSKKGCDHGQCGACTVLVNGRRINSCLTLAVMHTGQQITTIEGLSRGDRLHPMQEAFLNHDGFQCGYCTPGQIISAVALISEGHAHSDSEIREMMSGNLCRCGAYPNILAAVREVLEGKNNAPV